MGEVDEFDPATVPVRPAATVMLVRDSDDGLEVFMVRRTMQAVFAGGMYVFPGGRVDLADHAEELEDVCDGLDDDRASRLLQIERGGLAYWVAAIRECFEEAGVLLARSRDAQPGIDGAIRFDTPEVQARFDVARHAIHDLDSSESLHALCRSEDLVLITDAIHYVSHWITPVGQRRRFDTRFFVARAPWAQEPLHDDTETIASLWIRPVDAIERCRAGTFAIISPTIANLEFLVPHDTADDALAAAARVGTPPAILPRLSVDAGGRATGIATPADSDSDSDDLG